MNNLKRFKIYTYNIALKKMYLSFKEDEYTIVSFSSSNNFASKMLSKTGINKLSLPNFDTTLYNSVFFTNYGIYCLICDTSGRYLTHIFIKYKNLAKIDMELKYDFINLTIQTNNSYIYSGRLFGDISNTQKDILKNYKCNIIDSKIVSLMDHSESLLNKVINKLPNIRKHLLVKNKNDKDTLSN